MNITILVLLAIAVCCIATCTWAFAIGQYGLVALFGVNTMGLLVIAAAQVPHLRQIIMSLRNIRLKA